MPFPGRRAGESLGTGIRRPAMSFGNAYLPLHPVDHRTQIGSDSPSWIVSQQPADWHTAEAVASTRIVFSK